MNLSASEVSRATGVPRRTLRSWADRGVVCPSAETASGRQARYTPEDVRRADYLHFLREQKIPQTQAEALLGGLMRKIEVDLHAARVDGARKAIANLGRSE